MDLLANYPVEILEMIFLHLTEEILKWSLVCPKANRIFSNSAILMQNCRFKIQENQHWLGSRRYSQFDLVRIEIPSIFDDLPLFLTQLTFDDIRMEAQVFRCLLSKISGTLELLLVNMCVFYDRVLNQNNDEIPEALKQPLQFPNLRTLVLIDLAGNSRLFVLSIVRAINLNELGLIKILRTETLELRAAKMFVDLVNSNPNIKNLHVPAIPIHLLLGYPKTEHRLEDLSISLCDPVIPVYPEHFDLIINFLESQKFTLKSCRLEGCVLEQSHIKRLLSLNLVSLGFFRCKLKLYTVFYNSSIESLAFIGITAEMIKPTAIRNFLTSCRNLCAYTILTQPPCPQAPAYKKHVQTTKQWKRIDTAEMAPKHLSWANRRSVRYDGVFHTLLRLRPNYDLYQDTLKQVPIEKHPYLIIEFETSRTRLAPFQEINFEEVLIFLPLY